MGHVRDPEDAEDEAEARGDDEEDGRSTQANEDLAEECWRTDQSD